MPHRLYIRNDQGLLVSDGLRYHDQHVAEREARKVRRVLGAECEVRPA